jgi:ribA/ribD-fused uncharacterized protein
MTSTPLVDTIDKFEGEYAFLSNFYESPALYEGVLYPTSEHAYQAAKTLVLAEREQILKARTAGQAKRLGKQVTLRFDWEEVKVGVMREVLVSKFQHSLELKQKLVATGDAYLEEGNWWGDVFWGVCKGIGQNKLGLLLMQLRSLYK